MIDTLVDQAEEAFWEEIGDGSYSDSELRGIMKNRVQEYLYCEHPYYSFLHLLVKDYLENDHRETDTFRMDFPFDIYEASNYDDPFEFFEWVREHSTVHPDDMDVTGLQLVEVGPFLRELGHNMALEDAYKICKDLQ